MKEQDIIDLGFERTNVSAEESGDNPFYYYTYNITDELCLISSDNEEAKKNGWRVEMFDYDNIEFTSKKDIEKLYAI